MVFTTEMSSREFNKAQHLHIISQALCFLESVLALSNLVILFWERFKASGTRQASSPVIVSIFTVRRDRDSRKIAL